MFKNEKFVDEVIIGAPWQVTENMIKQFNISYVVTGTILDAYSKSSYLSKNLNKLKIYIQINIFF